MAACTAAELAELRAMPDYDAIQARNVHAPVPDAVVTAPPPRLWPEAHSLRLMAEDLWDPTGNRALRDEAPVVRAVPDLWDQAMPLI